MRNIHKDGSDDGDAPGVDRRQFLAYAGTGATATLLAGCSGEDVGDITPTEADDGTEAGDGSDTDDGTDEGGDDEASNAITIVQDSLPTTLDPHDHREAVTTRSLAQAYEGLIRRNADAEIIAQLATDYERLDDETVRFHLREGVQFHSGAEMTAEDVAYSINRTVDPDVGIASPQADQLTGVAGAEPSMDGAAVDVNLTSVNPAVFALFAAYLTVMEREWTEGLDDGEVGRRMNGTGPYEVGSYEEDVELVYERFDDYWGEQPDVERATFQGSTESSSRWSALASGEADLITDLNPNDAPQVEENEATRIDSSPATRLVFVAMKYNVEPFDSVPFRQAMNYAIDLDAIIENVLSGFGVALGQPTLPNFFGYNPDVDPYPYEPDTAQQLVDESEYDDVSLTLHSPVGDVFGDVQVAQAVAGYISDLDGVSCEVRQREFASLAGELTDGNMETSPDMYLISWGNASFDTSAIAIPVLASYGSLTTYANDELDELFRQAEDEPDVEARRDLYHEAMALAHDEAPWIYLHQHHNLYGVSERLDWEARADEQIYVKNIGLRS